MRIDGRRRRSGNVEDRRSIGGRAIGIGGGILGAIVIGVITLLSGGNIGDVARNVIGNQASAPGRQRSMWNRGGPTAC